MGALLDAREVLVCRRLAYRVNRLAHLDWPWRDLRQRSCRVEEGPL